MEFRLYDSYQLCPVELSVVMDMFCIYILQMVATSHMKLSSTWNVAGATEDTELLILFNFT